MTDLLQKCPWIRQTDHLSTRVDDTDHSTSLSCITGSLMIAIFDDWVVIVLDCLFDKLSKLRHISRLV